MRILYVEDNLTNLLLVQRLARIGSHEVISHGDGETALARFEQDKPDLVLMDLQLGGAMNGLDVVKALRLRGHTTPIIAVTAYAMIGDRERCLEAGCDAYLPKPLPVEELVEYFQRYDPKTTQPAPEVVAAENASKVDQPERAPDPTPTPTPASPPAVATNGNIKST